MSINLKVYFFKPSIIHAQYIISTAVGATAKTNKTSNTQASGAC
jgi:hypothetical protein